MNNRGTYALLALFFAGLCGLWLADFARIPTARDRERMRGRVLVGLADLKPDDLRRIEIVGGAEPLVFERREGNSWQMTAPFNVAADPSKVETLAFNLKELTRKPEADPLRGDPATFGLAPPEQIIRLWGAPTDAPIATLELGKTSLDRRFVRPAGSEGVDVVDARAFDLLRLLAVRWRDHELFRVPSFEVNSVTVARPGGTLKLRRDPDAWRIVGPIKALAAEPRVDGLIADLGSIRVTDDSRFVADNVKDDDLDRYGLKAPGLKIEVEAGRGDRRRPTQVLFVGKPVEGRPGQVYVRRGGQDDVMAVDDRALKDIQVDPNRYRSPKVADFNPDRVVRIGVVAEGHDFEVVRAGRDWNIVRPSPALADRQAVQSFLKSLDRLQTGNYLAPSPQLDSGLDHPAIVLKIWQAPDPREVTAPTPADPKGELALTLRVGRRDAARKALYAQTEGDDRTVLALPESAGDFLPRNLLAFRDHLVLAVPTGRIERLAFSGSGRKVALNAPPIKLAPLANVPIGWWMVEPVAAPADSVAVGRLFRMLSGLRAESLVAEASEDPEKYGLKTPALTLTVSALRRDSMVLELPKSDPSPGAVATEDLGLLIGASVPGRPGSRYARLSDRPLIFTVGTDVLAVLDAEYHDRQVLRFDPDRIRRVHLDWPGRGFSMTPSVKDGYRTWTIEGAVDARGFDLGRVGPLLDSCAGLTTEHYARYDGDLPPGSGLDPARVAIRFDLDVGTPSVSLRIGNPAGIGQLYATNAAGSKGPIFFLPASTFAGLAETPGSHDDLPGDVFAP